MVELGEDCDSDTAGEDCTTIGENYAGGILSCSAYCNWITRRCSADLEWVPLSGGSFSMGNDDGELSEKPTHTVTVGSFEMTKTEVTVWQYGNCVDDGACTAPETGGDPLIAHDCTWDTR